MKVVHINAVSVGGGAAIAATRHVEAMINAGYDACLVASRNEKYNYFVKKIPRAQIALAANLALTEAVRRIQRKILAPIGTYSFNYTSFPVHKMEVVKESDIIIIHWINGLLDTSEIEKILKLGKPTYWYMHDMYPITGGCHHALECNKYTDRCYLCTLCTKAFPYDFARHNFDKKLKVFSKYSNLSFITPSTWLGCCVRKSKIGQGHNVFVIPNVINTDIFKPLGIETKSFFGLNSNKRTILFSANNLDDPYKGAKFVFECLKKLDPEKYEGLVIGVANQSVLHTLPINVISTGRLSDEIALSVAYNACDTVLISSVAENYPNVVLEAMACGKPCIGFQTGGISDLIKHEISGYLTKEKTASSLCEGIDYVFASKDRYENLSSNARKQIVNNNSYSCLQLLYNKIGL